MRDSVNACIESIEVFWDLWKHRNPESETYKELKKIHTAFCYLRDLPLWEKQQNMSDSGQIYNLVREINGALHLHRIHTLTVKRHLRFDRRTMGVPANMDAYDLANVKRKYDRPRNCFMNNLGYIENTIELLRPRLDNKQT